MFKNTYFEEHMRTAASGVCNLFMDQNVHISNTRFTEQKQIFVEVIKALKLLHQIREISKRSITFCA